MKLPNPDKTEVFVMRLSKKNKQQLEELSKRSKFGNNSSEVIRYLIETAYLKR
jgi:predicted DNA-binding protein